MELRLSGASWTLLFAWVESGGVLAIAVLITRTAPMQTSAAHSAMPTPAKDLFAFNFDLNLPGFRSYGSVVRLRIRFHCNQLMSGLAMRFRWLYGYWYSAGISPAFPEATKLVMQGC